MITFEDLKKTKYPFLVTDIDIEQKYMELIYRQTHSRGVEYEFRMFFEDSDFWMYVVQKDYCAQEKKFYQTNSVSIPTKFKTVKDVYDYIAYFLNNFCY